MQYGVDTYSQERVNEGTVVPDPSSVPALRLYQSDHGCCMYLRNKNRSSLSYLTTHEVRGVKVVII